MFFEIQSFEDKIAIGIDATQIKQVLEYIIMNAIEAMNHKGELKIVIEQLRMSAENEFHLNEGDYIKTLIIDNGCGIEPRYLDYVFDAFFTTKTNCTGLGLTIARSIIEKHNGFIGITSELSKGTIVDFYLKV